MRLQECVAWCSRHMVGDNKEGDGSWGRSEAQSSRAFLRLWGREVSPRPPGTARWPFVV